VHAHRWVEVTWHLPHSARELRSLTLCRTLPSGWQASKARAWALDGMPYLLDGMPYLLDGVPYLSTHLVHSPRPTCEGAMQMSKQHLSKTGGRPFVEAS
jgi:hypothetical protein